MNTDTTSFARITKAARVRTEGQQQRLDRRTEQRARQAGRRQDRGVKRGQAFA